MPRALLANNASTSLSAAILSTGATTFSVTSAVNFPTPTGGQYFYATLLDGAMIPEVVKVTDVTGTTFTVVRGQDGTAARTFANGASVKLMLNKAVMSELAALTEAQSWPTPQRAAKVAANTGAFDLSLANNFTCTPTASVTLAPSNLAADQSGYILLVNGSNYSVSKAANVKCGSSLLASLSATGTYLLSYYCDGTYIYVTGSGALS